jgi:hypothetical protein
MAEYSRMARGSFISTGAAQVINLPFQPDYVEFFNFSLANTAATSQNVISGKWQYPMGQGTAVTQGYNATPALIYDTVAVNGISTFSAGQMLQYGPSLTVNVLTKASAGVVTTSTAHNLASGDVVIFTGLFETTTTGMPQINGIPFTVTVTGATTFSIPWNTNQSNYTAISAGSTGTPRVKKVLYPYIYFPGTTFISAITAPNGTTIPTGSIQIDTTDAHNFVAGQEVAFRVPSQWGSVELNSLPNIPTPGSPIYGYVDSVTDYNTVIVRTPFAAAFTAFNSNQTVASVPGLSYPQIVAVGDVNTGGVQISSGSALYPPPYFIPIGTTRFNTINGPAIQGAFVNNTSQGFIIGAGLGTVLTTGALVGASTNIIYWRALYHDLGLPL